MTMQILVTAVGGDLGQALVKALRLSPIPLTIHGCDMDSRGIGSAFVDHYHVVPPAHSSLSYLEALNRICREMKINAVIPGSDAEITVLSESAVSSPLENSAVLVCQSSFWIKTYGDKLKCMQALQGKVELAPFADGMDALSVGKLVEEIGFPLIVKSRLSSGAKSLRIVENGAALKHALSQTDMPLVQQYLDDEGGEFSAGFFACKEFETAIVFQRDLGRADCSWYAETVSDPEVMEYVRAVAKASGAKGSINIQVRKTSNGVRLLEINPRFSSLVAARAVCGFLDAEWSLQQALGIPFDPPSKPYRHIRFRRFYHELIDFGEGYQSIKEWNFQE